MNASLYNYNHDVIFTHAMILRARHEPGFMTDSEISIYRNRLKSLHSEHPRRKIWRNIEITTL